LRFAQPYQPIQHQILVKKVLQHRAKVVEKMKSKNLKRVKKMHQHRAQKASREGQDDQKKRKRT